MTTRLLESKEGSESDGGSDDSDDGWDKSSEEEEDSASPEEQTPPPSSSTSLSATPVIEKTIPAAPTTKAQHPPTNSTVAHAQANNDSFDEERDVDRHGDFFEIEDIADRIAARRKYHAKHKATVNIFIIYTFC